MKVNQSSQPGLLRLQISGGHEVSVNQNWLVDGCHNPSYSGRNPHTCVGVNSVGLQHVVVAVS